MAAPELLDDALQRLLDAAGEDSYVTPLQIDPARTYRVATTDFIANVAYKSQFDCEKKQTGLKVREELRKRL